MILIIAGILSYLIAALHLIIIFVGAEGYRYFDAGEEMARMAEKGHWYPPVITLGITVVFIAFGLYAWSGAKLIGGLPFLRIGLIVIAAIFLLRGAVFFVQVFDLIQAQNPEPRHAVFSFVSLVVGLTYLTGIIKGWSSLAD